MGMDGCMHAIFRSGRQGQFCMGQGEGGPWVQLEKGPTSRLVRSWVDSIAVWLPLPSSALSGWPRGGAVSGGRREGEGEGEAFLVGWVGVLGWWPGRGWC